MKLKISLANLEEAQCMKSQEMLLIDKLLSSLFDSYFQFPKKCIKRTDEVNVVEIGDFANDSEKMLSPVTYAKTLLNLTFGQNYKLEEVK
jgi:hypothetical protein